MQPMSDGGDSLLLDNVEDFILAGDTIYYATESSIFSYDIKKAESVENLQFRSVQSCTLR